MKILVVAAHPDDEILGCGGTMARFSSEGHEVHILIMAEGLTSRDVKRDRNSKINELSELAKIAQKAGNEIGANSIELLDFPDNRMDSVDRLEVTKVIETRIEKIKPSIIFTHFSNDLNIDHRIVNDAVVTACRPYPGQAVKELYFFEIPSSTEWQIGVSGSGFAPNFFVDISGVGKDGKSFIENKMEALRIYKAEIREFPHARSIDAVKALATWRGVSAGFEVAEAFSIGRVLE